MNENQLIGGTLSKEQLDFYKQEGYLLLPDLLSEQDMEAPRLAMQEKVSMIADKLAVEGLVKDKLAHLPFETRLAALFSGLTDEHFLKFGRGWHDRAPGYFHLMSNKKILDVIESLIGGEIFASPIYNVRPKVPRVAAGAVPWHQDKSYWPDAKANPVITVWIPLVHTTMENGCLHIKAGTQDEQLIEWHLESYSGTGYIALHEEQLMKWETLPLPVKAGTAILFNDRLLHMSTPNNSNGVRWSMDLRYQPTEQDQMLHLNHGAGFLARSYKYPQRVATLEDWLVHKPEHIG